jgi:hypothetical protein
MRGVLTLAIKLWTFGSPKGLPSPHFGSVSLIFTLSQSRVATCIIYLKDLNMKSQCILLTRISLYFMMVHVSNRCQAQKALSLSQFQFVITYCPRGQRGKLDVLSHRLYLVFKKRDVAYDQRCDTIFKPKNHHLQALLIIPKDKTLFQRICEDLLNDSFVVFVKSHWNNPLNDFDKFKFVMVCLSWWIVIRIGRPCVTSSSPSQTWHIGCWPFWIERDHGINVSWLLMASILEIHEGIFGIMWCLCSCKESSSSPSCTFWTIIGPYFTIVFNLHGLHHGSSTI